MMYRIRRRFEDDSCDYFDSWRFDYKNGGLLSEWGEVGTLFASIQSAKDTFYNPIQERTVYEGRQYEIVEVEINDLEVAALITL